ncbi:MAG TPA: hypothetical protein VFJ30_10890 [Phycisphaerae bacterium]|nr:hypothetical protein [Phycisphaerae bacterium]
MLKRIAFVAAIAGVVAFAASAGADPLLTFNLDQAYVRVTPDDPDNPNDSPTIDVYEGVWTRPFQVNLEDNDPAYLGQEVRDSVGFSDIDAYSLLLHMNLKMTSAGWQAEGTMSLTVKNGLTEETKILAKFLSTDVFYGHGGQHALRVMGNLYTDLDAGMDSILVGTGNDWVLAGDSQFSADNGDGVANQITVKHTRPSWDNGTVVTLRVGDLSPETMEDFLATGVEYTGSSQLMGKIIPVPAAFGLGLVGLSLVGWLKRRSA